MQEHGRPLGHGGALVSQAASDPANGNATRTRHDVVSGKQTSTAAGCVPSYEMEQIM